MENQKELLLHELGDLLYAERTIEKMLPKAAKKARDPELRERMEEHLEETRQQVANLEKAFRALRQQPQAQKCPGILGLREEFDQFLREEEPSREIAELFTLGSTARVEHYEIAAYTGAIAIARAIGNKRVVELLDQNLRQEKAMLKDVESFSKRLAKEQAQGAPGTTRSAGRKTAARGGARGGRSSASAGRTAGRSRTTSRSASGTGTRRGTKTAAKRTTAGSRGGSTRTARSTSARTTSRGKSRSGGRSTGRR